MANTKQLVKGKSLNSRRFLIGVTVVVLSFYVVSFFITDDIEVNNVIDSGIDSEEIVVLDFGLPPATPLKISIPKANIEAEFEAPAGLESNGELSVPEDYDSVAYYKYGPTPGELGPAVILGHVDSKEGPAVFFSLGQLEIGDEIFIDREDGTTVTFEVTELERRQQSDFPTEDVYGNIDHAGLRLITCTGIYNRSELRYTHNLIVYAKMVVEELEEPNN